MRDEMKPVGVRFLDSDRQLYRELQDYAIRRGLTMSAAIRNLVGAGLALDQGRRDESKDLLISMQAQLSNMEPRLAKDGKIFRTLMVTALESTMISRRLALAADEKLLKLAQSEALKAFRELERDGWL